MPVAFVIVKASYCVCCVSSGAGAGALEPLV